MRLACAAAVFVLLATAPIAAVAEGLRCGSQVIDVGDTAIELEAACGPADHVDRRTVVRSALSAASRHASEVTHVYEEVETWTYGAGDGRMMRLVEVRRGLVAAIKSIAIRRDRDLSRCLRTTFALPAQIGQVELACGAPDDRSRWVEERVVRTARGTELRTMITFERWIYDPGPTRFIRIFEFEDGRLVRTTTGGRGSP